MPQLTLTKVRSRRALRLWMARAISSFAGVGLAEDENRRVRRRYRFHLSQDAFQASTFIDNLFKIMLGADLLFQVEILLGQSVLKFGYLSIGLRVLHYDRDLL